MPTVNTTSVREELERLQSEFKRLSAQGNVTVETALLLQSMFTLVNIIVSVFMEKATRKDTRNSSKPSSQTDKDESALPSNGSRSHGKREDHERSAHSRTVETIEIAKVEHCNRCDKDLRKAPCERYERRTKIDIVFEKVIEHIDAEVKTCPDCKAQVKGAFPSEFAGPLQYGAGIKAYLINLVMAQMVALSRAQKLVKALIGVVISESVIMSYVMQLYAALERWEESAKEALLKESVLHCDETSLRVAKQNYWTHVYSGGEITLKFLHRKRGNEAVQDIGILPRYGGVVVHDCWASYFSYRGCRHALCGSHLLRELTFVIESNGYAWARRMKRLLKETSQRVSKRSLKRLSPREYARLQKRYRNILTRGEKELPAIPPRSDGKRGKLAKSDAHNLWERLKKHAEAVLLFAKESLVPFTNNRGERDLRMGKVKQKVSGCFRSEQGAKAYCRISSYLASMANRGYNPLIAIQLALKGSAPLEGGE